jgi:uncharacterized protein (TIRG00374 family)
LKAFKSVLKYAVSLCIGGGLLWLVFRNINLRELISRLGSADYRWLILSVIFAIISHYLRAYRWTMLLEPLGFRLSAIRAFWAVMGGYIANIALPRMGEVTRCVMLKKTDGIPIPASFGSVIIERIIDLAMLLGVIILSLFLQFGRISTFFYDVFMNNGSIPSQTIFRWGILLGIVAALSGILLWSQWQKIKKTLLFKKIKPLIGEMINGLMSIRRVNNKLAFSITTVLIWILYYLMTYILVFSFQATSGLNPLAGLIILVAGGLGMSAPVQGGIGTYHAFVSSALILYGINREDGVLYATFVHTSQLIFVLVVGSISLVVGMVVGRKKKKIESVEA